MFVYALIYNFNIKASRFFKDKWKVDRAQRSHAPCSRTLVDDQNYRSGIRPLRSSVQVMTCLFVYVYVLNEKYCVKINYKLTV